VCAGVAEYFNVDPVLVRIAAVVLAFSGPGLIAYVLAWIFVPVAESSSDPFARPPTDRHDRGTQAFGIVLLAVSVSILWGGWWSPARRWIFPLGLMALGAWLLLRRDANDPNPEPGPPDERGAPADATQVREALGQDGTRDSGPPPPPDGVPWRAGPPPAAPEPISAVGHRRRIVAPIVMGALLLWAGIASLADVSLQSGLAIALCIVGVGFVLGAFVGGSRALIVPALIVGSALLASSVVDIPLNGPVGQRTWAPLTLAQVDDRYELRAGEGRLDLSALRLAAGDHLDVAASIGIGHLIIELPVGVGAHISAHVGAGDTIMFGQSQSGMGVAVERSYRGARGAGTVSLDLEVGLGEVEVVTGGLFGARDVPGTTTTLG
jgi:phage shock protein PspC (stress-responsive transcriptional regulator)